MKSFMLLVSTLYFGNVLSAENNQTERIDVKNFCEKICSNPKWEFSLQEKASICLCWVDDSVDDVDASAMQKEASSQGFTLWVIRNRQLRNRRDVNGTSTTEVTTPNKYILKFSPQTEDKSKPAETHEVKAEKEAPVKKYKPPTDESQIVKKSTDDPIVGAAPKGILEKLTPSTKHKHTSSPRSCNAETLKLSLQNIKMHINRLLERADHANLNCPLLTPELETVKNSVQQLIVRTSERRENDRSRLIDQIREREKERHARIHSRLGYLDLPKRPSKLNLVGSAHNSEKTSNKGEKNEKSTLITQPKELIDD